MEKIKFKFALALTQLITIVVIVLFFGDLVYMLDDYFIPILFAYFFIDSVIVLVPYFNTSIFSGKQFKQLYRKTPKYVLSELRDAVSKSNRRALLVFILYFGALFVFGLIYINTSLFEAKHVYILFFLLNLGDYVCILFWCPFQTLLMKNSCCNTCRISNWDRLMKFVVLLLVPNIFTISLVVLAVIIFCVWEINHILYPERFYRISNASLHCANCDIKTCVKNSSRK